MSVMPCAIVALLFILSHFLAFWPIGLDPMVFFIVHTPRPTSKGLDHSYLHVYACLFLCFMLVLAFLVIGFAMLYALCRLDLVWLHPTPMKPYLDVIAWDASL